MPSRMSSLLFFSSWFKGTLNDASFLFSKKQDTNPGSAKLAKQSMYAACTAENCSHGVQLTTTTTTLPSAPGKWEKYHPEGQQKRKKKRTTMLRFAVTLFAVITSSTCQKYGCLEGDTHKPKPSPEPNMHECTLYAKSSCCYADFTEQLAHSPVIKVNNSYWNRCGQLSKSCEDFTKKIECFYRCSPHAARWIHPNYAAAIQSVPLCQSFCDDWYEACKDDSTCVRNWLTDWEWDESGENRCKNKCIPYSEMYANGIDMCQNMWGESFKVSKSSCLCLQMSKKDMMAIKYLLSESSEESSSVSSSEEHACQKKLLKFEKLKGKEGKQTR